MSNLTRSSAWQALLTHHTDISNQTMRGLFEEDLQRFDKFSVRLDDFLLDYSKNIITEETKALLISLARQSNLSDWIKRQFNGEKINTSEARAVLHTALRSPIDRCILVDGKNIVPDVHRVLEHMRPAAVQRFDERARNAEQHEHRERREVVAPEQHRPADEE